MHHLIISTCSSNVFFLQSVNFDNIRFSSDIASGYMGIIRVHLGLGNMFVGAKHDLRQYGIITNNLYAVMLRPPQKPDVPNH
jgi:hypothetical protein